MRLYHPELGVEIEAANDGQAAIYRESGWLDAPEPPAAQPGVMPRPVTYERNADGLFVPVGPVPAANPKPVRKSSK